MDIHDRNQRRNRAMNIFEAEAREQQLSTIALRQAALDTEQAVSITNLMSDPSDPVAGLRAIDQTVEADILNAHRQLQSAHASFARMAATDPELARLNELIDGNVPDYADSRGDIIDGEAIEVT